MKTINNKIEFFHYNILQMFHAQNAMIELKLPDSNIDDYADLICHTKDSFISKYKRQMTTEQIETIYSI
jgi:hypothetical protein